MNKKKLKVPIRVFKLSNLLLSNLSLYMSYFFEVTNVISSQPRPGGDSPAKTDEGCSAKKYPSFSKRYRKPHGEWEWQHGVATWVLPRKRSRDAPGSASKLALT